MANVIVHNFGETQILHRAEDGYLNATAMCKAAGKLIGNYLRNAETNAFVDELSSDMRISISELIQVVKGGNGQQGTWVHPKVAIHLAQWLSPEFAVQVTNWVYDWMMGKSKMPETVAAVPAIEYKPLNPQQQVGLSKAVRIRAKEAQSTTQRIYRELRDVYEVASWREIPAGKYTEAKALVKSMVLEGELMPRQQTLLVAPPAAPRYHQQHQNDVVVIPMDDWMQISGCIRGIAQAMDAAWQRQGGRSANNWGNPSPRMVEIHYEEARQATRYLGKIYQHTFNAWGV